MVARRKTVNIDFVKTKVNYFLAESDDTQTGERRGAASVLEMILFNTDNYRGFSYLPSEWDAATEKLRDGYDDSRRLYH